MREDEKITYDVIGVDFGNGVEFTAVSQFTVRFSEEDLLPVYCLESTKHFIGGEEI